MNLLTLRIEFHPTGEGYVLCRRFRDDKELTSHHYNPRGLQPLGLTLPQRHEYELACQMELEA